MRTFVYLLLISVFIITVLYKGSIISNKEKQEIISISEEWNKNGKPVDIIIAKKGRTYSYRKVTGVIGDRRTIVAEVPPENILDLKPGQKFDSTVYSDIKGSIEWISERRDIVTGLFALSLGTEKKVNLPVGAIVPVRVKIATYYNTIQIPLASVIMEEDSIYCWVIENNKAVKREVKPGLECDGDIQIMEGLSEGSKVCVNGMSKLSENDKVLIRKQVER